jgi:hypothetical protein
LPLHAILDEGVPTTKNSRFADDGSTRPWQENTSLLDAWLGSDSSGEWFGVVDYPPVSSIQISNMLALRVLC